MLLLVLSLGISRKLRYARLGVVIFYKILWCAWFYLSNDGKALRHCAVCLSTIISSKIVGLVGWGKPALLEFSGNMDCEAQV